MSRSKAQAIDAAYELLAPSVPESGPLTIVESATMEFDVGWVFFYQSARFLQTRELADSLVGNAPIFVPTIGGKAVHISYHRPVEESIAAYRACGNANAIERPEVALVGWRRGAQSVSAIQLVRRASGAGLAQSKRIIEDCLANQKPTVPTTDVPSARTLVNELADIGFIGEVRFDG